MKIEYKSFGVSIPLDDVIKITTTLEEFEHYVQLEVDQKIKDKIRSIIESCFANNNIETCIDELEEFFGIVLHEKKDD